MFETLRRAKSFIHPKSRREGNKDKEADLDLSESSHLRRNISIDGSVLDKQSKPIPTREMLLKSTRLQRQVSRSHEHLHDEILEQIRQRNFGDSYSKKDAQKLKNKTTNEVTAANGFMRKHPAYMSQRNFHRRSLVLADSSDPKVRHKTNGDVITSNFDRKNAFYCSERPARNLESTQLGSSGDFLLKRRGANVSQNFTQRSPAYVPGDVKLTRKKSDLLDKSGLRNLFQKIKIVPKASENKDVSDSGCSTSSSTGSFSYEGVRSRSRTVQQKDDQCSNHSGSCSNTSTASSSGTRRFERGTDIGEETVNFDRNNKLYCSERVVHARRDRVLEDDGRISDLAYLPENSFVERENMEGISRKRQHSQAKPSFDRNTPAYSSERIVMESRKKAFDRIRPAEGLRQVLNNK